MTAFRLLGFLLLLLGWSNLLSAQNPPFNGTIFLDPDIITAEDPSTFVNLSDAGRGMRTMFDRRINNWTNQNVYLFNATYDDSLSLEIQVNPEFGNTETARAEAEKYAPVLGQLPTVLRKDAKTVWIHKGVNPFGGGNNNFLIHIGQAALYERDGILEETLVHEGSHTSLDDPHASTNAWIAAQQADPTFISTYARDNPTREDVAETFLLYLALRHRPERISEDLKKTIEESIPNRIAYFDAQDLDMYPIVQATPTIPNIIQGLEVTVFPNPSRNNFNLQYRLEQANTLEISLQNEAGQILSQVLPKQWQTKGEYTIAVNTQRLPAGTYYVQLKSPKGKVVRKVLVQ